MIQHALTPVTKAVRHIPKVGMISLGCAKNLVDAEIMLGDVQIGRAHV